MSRLWKLNPIAYLDQIIQLPFAPISNNTHLTYYITQSDCRYFKTDPLLFVVFYTTQYHYTVTRTLDSIPPFILFCRLLVSQKHSQSFLYSVITVYYKYSIIYIITPYSLIYTQALSFNPSHHSSSLCILHFAAQRHPRTRILSFPYGDYYLNRCHFIYLLISLSIYN